MKYRIFATILLMAVLATAFMISNQGPAAHNAVSAQSATPAQAVEPAAPNPENAALTGMKIN
jgi:Na+/H+ antiporter NhaC